MKKPGKILNHWIDETHFLDQIHNDNLFRPASFTNPDEWESSILKRRFSKFHPTVQTSQFSFNSNNLYSSSSSRCSSQFLYANEIDSKNRFSGNRTINTIVDIDTTLSRRENIVQRSTNNDSGFLSPVPVDITSSSNSVALFASATNGADNILFVKTNRNKFEDTNTHNTNTEKRILKSTSLSLVPSEITLGSYLKATCDYIDTVVYLVKTEVLNMGKIQDLKDKVGANQLTMPQKDIWRCLGAEFLGTALLIIIGCGCGLYTTVENKLPLIGVAICWGMTVATLAQSLGGVSGCHINPAVTIAFLVTGKIQLVKAGLYVFTQCLGAIIGTCVLKALTPEGILGNYCPTELNEKISPLQGFGIEVLLTFTLVTIIFGVSDENRTDVKGSAPLAIGLTVTALILFGGPLTGASLNPARSLGPSVVVSNWDNHWVFWMGPICGGIIASLLYQHLFRALRPDEVEAFEMETRAVDVKESNGSPPV